jgi:hypothetical protein
MSKKLKSLKQSTQTVPKSLPAAGSAAADKWEKEQIAALAHALWEAEGRPEGRAEEHWLKAETQIRQRSAA